jgi:hypothetical protein
MAAGGFHVACRRPTKPIPRQNVARRLSRTIRGVSVDGAGGGARSVEVVSRHTRVRVGAHVACRAVRVAVRAAA